jgi:hypothetical protein
MDNDKKLPNQATPYNQSTDINPGVQINKTVAQNASNIPPQPDQLSTASQKRTQRTDIIWRKHTTE